MEFKQKKKEKEQNRRIWKKDAEDYNVEEKKK